MKTSYIFLTLLAVTVLSGCAVYTPIEACLVDVPRGFWGGLIDGLVAPYALFCRYSQTVSSFIQSITMAASITGDS